MYSFGLTLVYLFPYVTIKIAESAVQTEYPAIETQTTSFEDVVSTVERLELSTRKKCTFRYISIVNKPSLKMF